MAAWRKLRLVSLVRARLKVKVERRWPPRVLAWTRSQLRKGLTSLTALCTRSRCSKTCIRTNQSRTWQCLPNFQPGAKKHQSSHTQRSRGCGSRPRWVPRHAFLSPLMEKRTTICRLFSQQRRMSASARGKSPSPLRAKNCLGAKVASRSHLTSPFFRARLYHRLPVKKWVLARPAWRKICAISQAQWNSSTSRFKTCTREGSKVRAEDFSAKTALYYYLAPLRAHLRPSAVPRSFLSETYHVPRQSIIEKAHSWSQARKHWPISSSLMSRITIHRWQPLMVKPLSSSSSPNGHKISTRDKLTPHLSL